MKPEFEIGEKVFMFLKKRIRFPYEDMATVWWGNRKILDEKVSVPYTFKKMVFDDYEGRLKERVAISRSISLPKRSQYEVRSPYQNRRFYTASKQK